MSETTESAVAVEPEVANGLEAQTDAGVSDGAPAEGSESTPEVAPEGKSDDTPAWFRRKIDRATYERREAERQAQAARDEAEQLRRALAQARGEEQKPEQQTPDQIRHQERQRLETEQQQRAFVERCNAVAHAVAKSHGNAGVIQATQMLRERADFDFGNKRHQSVLEDISELPNAGDVYYALAHDPDTASAILNAPDRRQYAMLMEFAGKVSKPAQDAPAAPAPAISKAPAPVSSPTGAAKSGKRSIYDPNLSPADFDRLWKEGVRS